MIYLYIVLFITSLIVFAADMTLRYMEKIKNFGSEKRFVKFKGENIPIELFFPLNITMLIMFFVLFSFFGLILTLITLVWYLTLPCALISGFLGIFIFQYFYMVIKNRRLSLNNPKGEIASGAEGMALEFIHGDDYGMIEFEHNGVVYHANALPVNHADIEKFERVIILFEENGFYFIESIKEVFDILKDKDEE